MKKFVLLSLLLIAPLVCFAGSVKLINNSAYRLRAVIRGNDGTFLGELTLNSQQTTTWTDDYGIMGRDNQGGNYVGQFYRSQTPYTVSWYCMDGGDYALCDGIPTGGAVAALSCNGTRICKPSKQNPGSTTPTEEQDNQNYFKREIGPPSSQKGPP